MKIGISLVFLLLLSTFLSCTINDGGIPDFNATVLRQGNKCGLSHSDELVI